MTKQQKITLSASRDIPLNKLMLSQSNVRHVKAGVSIEELAEDIARRTLLSSITVRPVLDDGGAETGMYTIPAGGRRFRALELLVKQKRMNKTALVPCIVRTDGLAEEDSLAENVQRAPLHPLDQLMAFTVTVSAQRIVSPPSPYILQAGAVIPAALITGLRSDLPGQISAQVTSNVYDSPSGRYLLIPQGARLLGEYNSRIAAGQSRLLLVWTRLILPDGRSIVLERAPGTDGTGASGLQDRVNYHWGRVFLAAGLATILNLGLESGADSENDVARAIREAAQDTIGRTGDEIVQQQLAVPPTLTIRPGFPVRVMVTRDLILEPLGEVR